MATAPNMASAVSVLRGYGLPKVPPHLGMQPVPDGLWVADGVEDELAPPESPRLVLPLPPGLPLVDGDGEDREDELCWFMHWATAKPTKQDDDVTTREETSCATLPGCV